MTTSSSVNREPYREITPGGVIDRMTDFESYITDDTVKELHAVLRRKHEKGQYLGLTVKNVSPEASYFVPMEIEVKKIEYRFPGRTALCVVFGDCRIEIGYY